MELAQVAEIEDIAQGHCEHMAARCLKLRNALQAIVSHCPDHNCSGQCAGDMAEIAERALKAD